MRRVVTCLLVLAAVSAFAAKKTSAEYLAEIPTLNYEVFSKPITTEKCYDKLETFLGCVHGLNAVLGAAEPPLALMPNALAQTHPRVKETVQDLGKAKIVSLKPAPKEKSVLALVKRQKKERDEGYAAWRAVRDANQDPLDFAAIAVSAKEKVLASGRRKEQVITAAGIDAYLGAADDPHTYVKPQAELEASLTGGGERFAGIGVNVQLVDDSFVVIKPLEGKPAHLAGVKAKDIITHVDDKPLAGKALSDATDLIRGPEGTEVKLALKRGMETKEIKIIRAVIEVKNVTWKMLPDNRKGIGYLKLNDFMDGDFTKELSEAIVALEDEGAKSLVLDLRGNGGGLLSGAVSVANLFVGPDIEILSEKDLKTRITLNRHRTRLAAQTELPLVTLIDGGSASASEIVSGALQDLNRSILVGERTFGKGSVQRSRPFAGVPGLLLFRTVATFHLPSGRSNQLVGVLPHYEVFGNPNPTEDEKFTLREEDIFLNALPATSVAMAPPKPSGLKNVTECLDRTGQAKAMFEADKDAAIPADYQLLFAQDTATCME